MSDPQMAQWQQRFDAANAAAQSARTPQAKAAAYERLRQVQAVKPTGPGVVKGRLRGAGPMSDAERPAQSSGGILGGVMSHIRNAMASGNNSSKK